MQISVNNNGSSWTNISSISVNNNGSSWTPISAGYVCVFDGTSYSWRQFYSLTTAPVGMYATTTNSTSIIWGWSTSGSGIHYDVYISTSSTAPTSSTTPTSSVISSLTYTSSSLTQGTIYYFWVRVTGSSNPWSSTISGKTQINPALSAATSTSGGFTFTITNYNSNYSWSSSVSSGSISLSGASATVSGLGTGASATATIYTFYGSESTGNNSTSGTALGASPGAFTWNTPTDTTLAPNSVPSVTVTDNSNNTFSVSWSAPSGGASSYSVSLTGANSGSPSPSPSSNSTSIAPFSFSSSGTQYATITPYSPSSQARVTWNPSSGATSYTISTSAGTQSGVTGTSTTFTGLTPGTTFYVYSIIAYNAYGNTTGSAPGTYYCSVNAVSTFGTSGSATVTHHSAPSAPTFTLSAGNSTHTFAGWIDPSSTGATTVYYSLYRTATGTGTSGYGTGSYSLVKSSSFAGSSSLLYISSMAGSLNGYYYMSAYGTNFAGTSSTTYSNGSGAGSTTPNWFYY